MFYLFLDVDGVLNNDKTQDFVQDFYIGISSELVDNLKILYDKLVERYGVVKIILSSTWKHEWHKAPYKILQDEFADRLDEALAEVGLEVYDKISESSFHERGYLIWEYMRYCPCDDYVILDDEAFDFEEMEMTSHLIRTNEHYGLTEFDIDKYFFKIDNSAE